MTGKSLLLVLVLICYNAFLTTQPVELFPTNLKTLCPHSSFCEDEKPATIPTETEDVRPCCSSCSCSKDCGRKRNCCKYEYDVYKLDETLDTICKQLIVLSDMEILNNPYFYIIDKCPNRSEICSSRNLTGSNSYFPVYSRDSGMIYYNDNCASCHKQENITRFATLLTCKKTNFGFLQKSRKNILDSDCILKFMPPNNVDLSTEVCYPFLISKCDPFFQTNEEYKDLCNSFNATFQTQNQKSFRNVFCYFCSSADRHLYVENWLESFEFCPTDNTEKVIGNVPYAVLFGTSMGSQEFAVLEDRDKAPLLCKQNNKEDCRPVFCPEGHIYLNGKCQILGKHWYFKMLRINVKLTVPPKNKDMLSTIFHTGNISNKKFVLTRQGLQDAQFTLSYNLANDNKTVRSFLAMLFYERLTVDPSSFLERVKMSLRRSWKLHINNQLFYLTPQLNRFLRYHELSYDSTNIHIPNSLSRRDYTCNRTYCEYMKEQIHFVAGPKSVYTLEKLKGAFFITKLFFCKLIELHDHEFEDRNVLLVVKNRTTYLGDGEFTWVLKDQVHKPVICVNDLPSLSRASALKQVNVTLLLLVVDFFYQCLQCS